MILSSWTRRGLACAVVVCAACSDDDPTPSPETDAGHDAGAHDARVLDAERPDAHVEPDTSLDAQTVEDARTPLDAQTDVQALDAQALDAQTRDAQVLDASHDAASDAGVACNRLLLKVRDFTPGTNPDFESVTGSGSASGIVESMLDAEHLPVFANGKGVVTGRTSFDQWFRDVPNVNQSFDRTLELLPLPNASFGYTNAAFFPIDGLGFGNYQSSGHNFHFTTQWSATFVYRGGEVFEFAGDDDVWMFINDRLAIDLGGVHAVQQASVDLDARANQLGIEKGSTYRIDFFHAERHTTESNYRIRTTIDCLGPAAIVI